VRAGKKWVAKMKRGGNPIATVMETGLENQQEGASVDGAMMYSESSGLAHVCAVRLTPPLGFYDPAVGWAPEPPEEYKGVLWDEVLYIGLKREKGRVSQQGTKRKLKCRD
jgi:hypothetical protein